MSWFGICTRLSLNTNALGLKIHTRTFLCSYQWKQSSPPTARRRGAAAAQLRFSSHLLYSSFCKVYKNTADGQFPLPSVHSFPRLHCIRLKIKRVYSSTAKRYAERWRKLVKLVSFSISPSFVFRQTTQQTKVYQLPTRYCTCQLV